MGVASLVMLAATLPLARTEIIIDACVILADSVAWTDLAPHVSEADQVLAQLGLGLRISSDNIFSVEEVADFNNTLDYPLCYYISGPDSPACDRSTPVVGEVTTAGWRSVDSCFKLTSDPSVAVMVTFGLLCNTRDLYNMVSIKLPSSWPASVPGTVPHLLANTLLASLGIVARHQEEAFLDTSPLDPAVPWHYWTQLADIRCYQGSSYLGAWARGTCEETAARVLAEEAPLYAGARLGDCRDRGIPTSMDMGDMVDTEAVDMVDTGDIVDTEKEETGDMVDTVDEDIEVDTEDMVDAVLETEKDTAVDSEEGNMKNLNTTTEVDTEDTVDVDTLPRSGKQLQEERKQKNLLYVVGGAGVVGVAVVLVVAGLVVTRCRHRGKTYTLGAGQEAGETVDPTPSPPLTVDSSPSPSPPISLDTSSSSLGRACTPV